MTTLLAFTLLVAPQEAARKASTTGDIRYHERFASKSLGNERTVRVYLPPGYVSSSARYPVLYMHDGQNLFDGRTSYIPNKEWRADEAAEALIRSGWIEPVILVGVDNAGMARGDEYLPTRAKAGSAEMGGKADKYGDFLVDELKPFIDRTYRTKTGRKDTAVCGSSFGGIVTLHLLLSRAAVFGKGAVVSPSVWWDGRVMLTRVAELKKKPDTRIWVDMGALEGREAVTDARDLAQALKAKGWRENRDLVYYEDANAEHNEEAWARRFDLILLFLFGKD
ncbi:MAG: alpha/beta hydrolase [Fimbriimonadaceae bacterium]|nr:alpha/beta hydrolase [Fimbriimonadaceae bacterium]QYK55531.1 MAG: alpha/beta hydrolase [Fimbriimonadaceae bacterium]